MELLCKTRVKLTNGKQRKSGKDPRRWQSVDIFKQNENIIVKLNKKENSKQLTIGIKDIVCFEKQTCGVLPDTLKHIKVIESGPTPYHKPNRTLSTEEKQKRYDYLRANHYPENVINVIERGYSAKDIKQTRQKNKDKDTGKPISKEAAIKIIVDKLAIKPIKPIKNIKSVKSK